MCFNQLQALYFLMLKLSHIYPVGYLSSWLLFVKTLLLAFIASYFLAQGNILGSSCISLALDLECAVSPKSHGSFYQGMTYKDHNMGTYCYWVVCF